MQITPQNEECVHTAVDFRCLLPSDIPGMFNQHIYPRLSLMQKKTGDNINYVWLYSALCAGDLRVWTAVKNHEIISIAVTQEVYNSLTGDKGLLVLALQADPGLNLTSYLARTFDEIAEFFGYSFLWAQTVRKGWCGRKYGWHQRGLLWGKEYVRRR